MTKADLFMERIGLSPFTVTAYENEQKSQTLYLRWRAGGNWKKRSLGASLRDGRGRIRPEIKRMALAEAERQYEILSGKRLAATAQTKALTVDAS